MGAAGDLAPRSRRGAILVLPTVPAGQLGPVAGLVSTAGWASGIRRVVGDAWTVTPAGVVSEAELRRRASEASLATPAGVRWQRRVPVIAKTAVKDVREWRRARAFRVDPTGPWAGHDVAFVWQRHELFHTAGTRLARSLGVPSVVFVPAPLLWQAEQWGVRRPGWRRWTERRGEVDPLRAADLVACGSETVADELSRLGVDERRLVVTPTGIDPELFASPRDRDATRHSLGVDDQLVVGWIGSFRRFHALEQAVDALVGLDRTTLLLVGDGPERARIERLARDRGVRVTSTGTVPHDEIPAYLAAMDVALVLAAPDRAFHYSPLKLGEYLASGLAVIAPRAGALPSLLEDGTDAILVTPGDVPQLAATVRRLRDDDAERKRLGEAARTAAAARWSWDRAVERVLGALHDEAAPAPPAGSVGRRDARSR